MKQASAAIQEGQPISMAMDQADLTTPVALRMLRVGERSGKIGDMMERIAAFYDDELSRWIDWFTRLFEPILMLFIGLVIGVVVLLLYMPILNLQETYNERATNCRKSRAKYSEVAVLIGAAQFRQAKIQAQLQQRRVLEVLEEITGETQEQYLQALCQTLHFSAIEMKEIMLYLRLLR